METQEETNRSSSIVKKVESKVSWDSYLNQANNQRSPIVVHFGASWCLPSVAMNSVFEELASTYHDVMFLSVDVDDVKEVSSKMEVKAMPTFVMINKDGVTVDKIVGANPDEIKKRVDSFVQSSGGEHMV